MNIYTDLSREDTTPSNIITNNIDSNGRNASILSAYFGLDNNIGIDGNLGAGGGNGLDGMPLVFSHELDWETVQPGDFHIYDDETDDDDDNESIIVALVSTFQPATDTGELRTVLLLGQFGSNPTKVCIVGNIWDRCHQINFKNIPCITPKPLIGVPELVFAEEIIDVQQQEQQEATSTSSSWCPSNASDHIIRVTWDGGITLENGTSITSQYANKYTVTLKDGSFVVPTTLADLNDGDNNHLLCFNKDDSESWNTTNDDNNNIANKNPPINVAMVGGFFTDPNEDGLNLPTNVTVTPQYVCPNSIVPTQQPTNIAYPSSSPIFFDSASSTIDPTTYPSPHPTSYSSSASSPYDDNTNISSGWLVVGGFSFLWMQILSVLLFFKLVLKY